MGVSFLKLLREARKRSAGVDGFCAGHGENSGGGFALGAADYLVKGFELDELRQRVANLLKLTGAGKGKFMR